MPEPDRHRVAVDLIIVQDDRVVLIERKNEPYQGQWCLPGGFVDAGEQVHEAAIREAKEETGLTLELDDLVGIYDAPGRDPRGPVISITYRATPTGGELAADTDAADARWWSLDDLPDLGFDHEQMIADACGTD